MVLRFDHLASLELLRMRVMGGDEASLEATVLATAVGAALTLLLLGAIYNVSLAVAVRRQFPAWQGAWAGCMVVWGGFWSQAHLLVLPALAGAPSAQICTGLSCLAITLATQSAMTALARDDVPCRLRRLTIALGLCVGMLGVPLSMMRHGSFELWSAILGAVVLATLLAVAVSMTLAWRRGSGEARAFAGAWVVPMIALASAEFLETDTMLWGRRTDAGAAGGGMADAVALCGRNASPRPAAARTRPRASGRGQRAGTGAARSADGPAQPARFYRDRGQAAGERDGCPGAAADRRGQVQGDQRHPRS
jgi:hypothetical protein